MFFGSIKAAPEARCTLQDPVSEATSLEDLNIYLQEPICDCRTHNIAAGAKILLQDIHNYLSKYFFVVSLRFKFSLKFMVFWTRFYLGFVLLAAKFYFSEP